MTTSAYIIRWIQRMMYAAPHVDMWSLRVFFLDLVSDDPSGLVPSSNEMKHALQSGTPYRIVRNLVGVRSEPDCIDLVEMCLHYNPYQRPTAGYLLKIVRSEVKLASRYAVGTCTGTLKAAQSPRVSESERRSSEDEYKSW
jgi:hypothetical protein